MIRRLLLACGVVLAMGAPAAAQDTIPVRRGTAAVRRDTVVERRDVRAQVLDKLRAVDAASRPVTLEEARARAAADTAATPAAAASDPTAARAPGAVPPDSGDVRAPTPAPEGGAAPGDSTTRRPPRPAAGVIVPADSVTALLLALEGYVVTEYRAEGRAHFVADSGQLELIGTPSLSRQGQGMTADSLLRYDQNRSIMCAYGKPVLEGAAGEPVQSDQVCYDVDREVGVALGARTKFTEGATWFVHGEELYTAGTDRLYGAGTEFTSCELEVAHYHFAARTMKVVHDHILVARDVTLNFGDVPVLWLPFMVQSLKQGRRSGLLAPSIGLQDIARTSSGYRRRISDIGFYWAINDHLGSQVALDWASGDYTAVRGSLDFRWQRQFLDGGIDFSRFWQAEGGTNFALRARTGWRPGERTSLNVSANYASSTSFVRERSFDPVELNRTIDSNLGLTHRFGWGNMNLNATRRQYLDNDQVDWTLPSLTLGISPITLFPASGDPRWYNSATWTGNLSFNAQRRDVQELRVDRPGQDSGTLDGSLRSDFRIGNLSWSQNVSFKESVLQARPDLYAERDSAGVVVVDTIAGVRRTISQDLKWSTSLGYSQRLIATSTLTPSLALEGGLGRPDHNLTERVPLPTRVRFSTSLQTNLYGFWPGVGPFSRFRHRIDPGLSYSYSPTPTVTDQQREVFGSQWDGLRETNQLTLTIGQTIEAKYAESDTMAAGAAADTAAEAGADGAPRRLPQAKKITLLSIRSSALVYDFVRKREGEYGLTTTDMSHTLSSDLLRGLSVNVGHDVFRADPDSARPGGTRRSFSPRLRRVNTGFELTSDSWLFRVLGLGGRADERAAADTAAADSVPGDSLAGADPLGGAAPSIIPTATRGAPGGRIGRSQPVGSWRARLDYSLLRPAAGDTVSRGNQQLRGSVSFQPTELWGVSWRTSYSFTDGEFSDHILTLTRDLHDWQANFDFVKAQNGNFVFQFRVHLIANPAIKLDYDQRSETLRDRRQR